MIGQSTFKRWLTTGSDRVTRGHATISHTDFLEGESSAFPLPTLAPLTASPSRTSSCDQGGLPPWNLRAFAPQSRESRSIRAFALSFASLGEPCLLRLSYGPLRDTGPRLSRERPLSVLASAEPDGDAPLSP